VHALDAIEEKLRCVFLYLRGGLPGRQRRQRARGGEFGFDAFDERFRARLADQHAATAVAIECDGRGATQRERDRQGSGRGRKS